MDSIIEIQNRFNRELIGGVAYHFLNNPIISWESGFIKGLTAICALFALIDLAFKIKDQKQFAVGFANFAFYLTIIMACYGQLDSRRFIDFGLTPKYDYLAKSEYQNQSRNDANLDVTRSKTIATLDRDVYNAVSQFFDSLAATIKGKRTIKNTATGEETDLQTLAFDSTIFFLKQIRIAKQQCGNQEGNPDYQKCLAAYIPRDAPVTSKGTVDAKQCFDYDTGKRITCKNGEEEMDEQGQTEAEKSSGGISIFGGDSFTIILGYVVAIYTWSISVIQTPLLNFFFPILLFVLQFIRSVISLVLLIGYGFGAAGMMFFLKLLTPCLLIPRYRSTVFNGYKLLLGMALFGFVSEIFLFFATVLTLGLREAAYQVAVPFMLETQVSGVDAAVQYAATFGLVVIMVYIGITSVLFIQIYALTKIPKACQMLTKLSIEGFVAMGGELAGMGAKLGMALGAATLAAPLAAGGAMAGAVATKGGAMAAGKLAAGGSKLAGAMASKGGSVGAIGNMLQRGGSSVSNMGNKFAKAGVKGAEKTADFFGGKNAGDKVRSSFGYKGDNGGGSSSSGGSNTGGVTKSVSDDNSMMKSKSGKSSLTSNTKSGELSEDGARKGVAPFGGTGSNSSSKIGSKGKNAGAEKNDSSEDTRSGLKKLIDKGRSKSKAFDVLASGASAGISGLKASKKVYKLTNDNLGSVVQGGVGTAMGGGGLSGGTINSLQRSSVKEMKNLGNATSQQISNVINNEDNRERMQSWAENVGLESEDRQLQSNSSLLNSFNSSSEKTEMSLDEASEFENLSNKMNQEDYQYNESEMAKFVALSRTRSLNDNQSKTLDKFQDNKMYKDHLQKKQSQYNIARDKFMSLGSTQSARELASLSNEGFGSSGDEKLMDKANSFNKKAFSSKVDTIDSNLSDLNDHASGKSKLTIEQRKHLQNEINSIGDSITSNRNLKSQIVGNAKAASTLSSSGHLTQEEAELISNAGSSKAMIDMVKDLNENIMRNNNINVSGEFNTEYLDNNEDYFIKDMNDKVIGDSDSGLKLSMISDESIREKMREYKENINFILNNQDYFTDSKGNIMYSESDIQKMVKFNDLIVDDE